MKLFENVRFTGNLSDMGLFIERYKLAEYADGKQHSFVGTYQFIDSNEKMRVTNLRDEKGRFIDDHIWLFDLPKGLNFRKGDQIQIIGYVWSYEKHGKKSRCPVGFGIEELVSITKIA
jgi:hypothetical protein